MPKIFGREPALWIGTISAVLSLLVGFGISGLNDLLVAALVAFLNAAAAAWIAWHTTPVLPTVFTGLVGAAAVLAGALGFDLTQHQVSLTAATAAAIVAVIARAQITPVTDQSSELRL